MSAASDPTRGDQKDLAQALHWLMPLHFFYEKRGVELPDFQFLDGRDVPYPYRSLLVHENDMTPTLAAFHHSKLYLEVLDGEVSDDFLLRLVILHSAAADTPVEFGAIGIQLAGFDSEVRDAIVEGRIPSVAFLRTSGSSITAVLRYSRCRRTRSSAKRWPSRNRPECTGAAINCSTPRGRCSPISSRFSPKATNPKGGLAA